MLILYLSRICEVFKMYKYTIARQLATKRVITNRGDEIGKLTDLIIDETTGDIESLLVEVDRESKVLQRMNKRDKIISIPYSAVTAVSDVFIVDEREVATAQTVAE
jgi:sporulation protein YlmC with PRC-barrel domain